MNILPLQQNHTKPDLYADETSFEYSSSSFNDICDKIYDKIATLKYGVEIMI